MVCITIQNKTNKNVSNNNNMLILLLSKIQALHIIIIIPCVVITYSVMIQYYSVKHKHTSKESGLQD